MAFPCVMEVVTLLIGLLCCVAGIVWVLRYWLGLLSDDVVERKDEILELMLMVLVAVFAILNFLERRHSNHIALAAATAVAAAAAAAGRGGAAEASSDEQKEDV